jgi:transcriptional regulator with XRE-family HTH domain
MPPSRLRKNDLTEAALKAAHLAAFERRAATRETIPIEQRIGLSIRRLRAARRLTLQELANGADLSSAMLSRLENGQTSVSLDALERLCRALGVSLSSIFKDVEDPNGFAQLIKSADQMEVIRTGTKHGHSYRLLAYPEGPRKLFEPFVIDMKKDSEIYPRFQHDGTEFIYMIYGRLRYRFGAETFLLEPGDAFTFSANVIHGPEELLDENIRFLSIMLYGDGAETPDA